MKQEKEYTYLDLATDLIWIAAFKRDEKRDIPDRRYSTPALVMRRFDESDPEKFFGMYQRAANWIAGLNRPNNEWLRLLNEGARYVMKLYEPGSN
jgi:hypothetical protein